MNPSKHVHVSAACSQKKKLSTEKKKEVTLSETFICVSEGCAVLKPNLCLQLYVKCLLHVHLFLHEERDNAFITDRCSSDAVQFRCVES